MLYKTLKLLIQKQSDKWALKRFNLFLDLLKPVKNSTILDLGGYNGKFFYKFQDMIKHLDLKIIIADIDELALNTAKERGFDVVLLDGSGIINLPDKSVDIVFCNSVIEHVTLPKEDIWSCFDDKIFKEKSETRQKTFAEEIKRVGKKYFVQTPHIKFPIESHTWLPFVAGLKRRNLINLIKFSNKFWIKKTSPDWNLLNEKQMSVLFTDADNVLVNKKLGFAKEIIAYKDTYHE